jgi:hypothetical protein
MNRMKNAQNWFEVFGLRAFRLSQPAARLVPRNIIWLQHGAPSGRSHQRQVSTSGNHRLGDAWETVTYTVLWLCGLVAIGLCWI